MQYRVKEKAEGDVKKTVYLKVAERPSQLGSQSYPARPSDIPHKALIDYRL